jgi:hypothetical protein
LSHDALRFVEREKFISVELSKYMEYFGSKMQLTK